ncbi:MAG: hypothetical protein D6812_13650 [Deltaproteobacteria bacterium]|nr:MAG: hypothetical protein D6812_13650 [Deltaproteobacteria bacterium]
MFQELKIALVSTLLSACTVAGAASSSETLERVRRISALLDYVAADYADAVRAGVVIDAEEYREQVAFLEDAARIARSLPAPASALPFDLGGEIAALGRLVRDKAPVARIAEGCRSLRRRLLDAYGLVLAPRSPPSRERGQRLYAQSCIPCHGAGGGGDGPRARELRPPPRSFQNPEVMVGLSPVRAFNALTDGIEGTAMPSFEVLSEADRWSLAYFIFALRHSEASAEEGRRILWYRSLSTLSLVRLAEATDGELIAWLETAGLEGRDSSAALAYLRRSAPYELKEHPLVRAHALLRAAWQKYARGDRSAAMDALTGAYLDGFEPLEPTLRSRDPDLVTRTERAFLDLRRRISEAVPMDELDAAVAELHDLLSRAELELGGRPDLGVAFVASMTVLLREGVESVLLILLLFGLAHRMGDARDLKMVHVGWIAALLAGGVLWGIADAVVPISGASRELVEGVIALLATAVLLYASHFVIARLDAKRRIETLRRKFASAGPHGRRFLLLSLAFTAVFREALEVVLFLQAILIDAPAAGPAVAAGAAAGLAACGILFLTLWTTGRRLNPGQILAASGVILCGLAIVMAGKGVHALQEAGWVDAHVLPLPTIEWLGFFPTVQTLGVQSLVVVFIVAIALLGTRGKICREAKETSAER